MIKYKLEIKMQWSFVVHFVLLLSYFICFLNSRNFDWNSFTYNGIFSFFLFTLLIE